MFEKVNPSSTDWYDRATSKQLTFGQSFVRGLSSNIHALPAAVEAVGNAMSKTPSKETPALNVMRMYEQERAQGNISEGGFLAGDITGYVLNPVAYGLGGAGSIAAKGAVKLAITNTASAGGKFAARALEFGAVGALPVVPEHIQAAFDEDTNSIDWSGVAKHVGVDFGIGAALPAVPFAWGMMRGKFKKAGTEKSSPGNASEHFTETDIEKAFEEKAINDDFRVVAHALRKGETPPPEAFNRFMKEQGFNYDSATGHVNLSMLKPSDIKAQFNSVADSLGSTIGDDLKNSLTHYISKGQLDEIVKNPKMIDGLKGFVDHVAERMSKKDVHLARYDKQIIDPFLTKGLTKELDATQEKIYQAIKQGEKLNGAQIPAQVKSLLTHEEKISVLKRKRSEILKKIETEKISRPDKSPLVNEIKVRQLEEDLIALEGTRPTLLHPTDEMRYLREQLTKKQFEGKLLLNEDFHRLTDLTAHWENAKVLHKRVLREEQYERQAAFAKISESLIKISEQSDFLPGNPDSVINYMKERINRSVKKEEVVSRGTKSEQPSLDELEDLAKTPEAKEAIAMVKNKEVEFRNEAAKKSFLSCMFGVEL